MLTNEKLINKGNKKSKILKKFLVPLLVSGIISSCGSFDSKSILHTTDNYESYYTKNSNISRHEYDLSQMEYIKQKDRGSPFDFHMLTCNFFLLYYKFDLLEKKDDKK